MKTTLAFLLAIASPLCLAQKWVDENGKVYYGTPPPGVRVQPAPMKGGTSSAVGSQPGAVRPPAPQQSNQRDPLSGPATDPKAQADQSLKELIKRQQERLQDPIRQEELQRR